MFFHETIPSLIDAVISSGEEITSETIIIRDASGRLTVAAKQFNNAAALKSIVVEKMGGYASTIAVVEGAISDALRAEPALRVRSITRDSRDYHFSYLDRRIVGSDWVSTEINTKPGGENKRIVFYSLKGGVGRSTALAIFAAYMASKGNRVLAFDLDIEAPGLGPLLLAESEDEALDQRPKFGVVDYLVENAISGVSPNLLSDFIGTKSFGDGFVDIVPAVGRETDRRPDQFMEKLSRAMTDDVSNGSVIPITSQVDSMISDFERNKSYDVVLIDARAGFSEISASAIVGLRAQFVLFGVDQRQTFTGYKYLLSHLVAQSNFDGGSDDWRHRILFVQAKAPATKRERARFSERLYELCAETIYDEVLDEAEIDAFSFSPRDADEYAPHNATFIRFDAAFLRFEPAEDDEQLDPELFMGAYSAFLSRLESRVSLVDGAA